eukprot:2224188-Rhodomonas_salina.1
MRIRSYLYPGTHRRYEEVGPRPRDSTGAPKSNPRNRIPGTNCTGMAVSPTSVISGWTQHAGVRRGRRTTASSSTASTTRDASRNHRVVLYLRLHFEGIFYFTSRGCQCRGDST